MAQLNDLLVLGKSYFRGAIKANSDHDLLAHSNEFNFASPKFSGDIYVNYRTASGSDGNIGSYRFCKGAGASFADIYADRVYVNGSANSPAMGMNYANGYWGMGDPDGVSTNWIRTTTQGIIPYQSGGNGSIGTSSWPFNEGYFKHLNVINDASNTGVDALAYFRHYSNNDWTVRIDSGSYDYGLSILNAHTATNALSITGGTRISNTLRIGSTSTTFDGNWCEGIRIGAADGQWVTIALGTTGETGTNANCWSIHRTNTGAFSISKNSSDGANGLFMNATGMALGHTNPSHRLHVAGDIKTEGTLYLERNKGGKAGRINFYKDTYNNWVEYMSDRTAGMCPTGGTPSSLGNVTGWARRSIVENIAGYGWVWEAAATTTTAASSSTVPTARMALSSSDGTLTVTGPIKSGSLPGTWVSGCNGNALVNSTMTPGSFSPMLSGGTTNGRMVLAFYTNGLQATYITKANCDSGTNTVAKTATLFNESGGASWPGTVSAGTFSGNGASLTSLNASNISSGTLAAARLPNHASTATTYGLGDATHYGHVILYPAASCTSYTSDSGGACTPAAVKKAVELFSGGGAIIYKVTG